MTLRCPANPVGWETAGQGRISGSLQGGDEGQLDRLPVDHDRVGALVAFEFVEEPVGVAPRRRSHAPDPAGAGPGDVETYVGGDAVEPRPRIGTIEVAPAAPGAEEGLLHGVLRIVEGRQHPIAVDVQFPPIPVPPLVVVQLFDGVDRHPAASCPTSCRIQTLPSGSAKSAKEA